MSVKTEKLEEKNMIKLTVEVPAEDFNEAIKKAYNQNKGRFNVPGFRKGKAPLQIIEKMYGAGLFYEDAANTCINDSYPKAVEESGEDIVSSPKIEVEQMEKGKSFIYTAEVAVKPEVTLGEYKGVEVKKADAAVTDEDVEKELQAARERASRLVDITDRPVQDGDQTTIDFKGYVDGKAFEGGEGFDYPLTIGSHSFIEGFEEQLIGKNIGEACEVNVTFPTEYHAEELAGKPAKFDVTVKSIKEKELPELNDEFADNVSDFSTLEEYKADLKTQLEDRKMRAATTENENNVVDKVVANAQMDLPKAMIDTEARSMADEYAQRLQNQGLNINDYLKYTGQTVEKLLEQLTPEAEKRIRTRLVLEKVAETENIEVNDEIYAEQLEKMAKDYQIDLDRFKSFITPDQEKQIRGDLKIQQAIDFLMAEAKLN
ncbi:MAG: trigger factor [Clostridium sp.]|jgi:trigger factor|nr:trigger factor [Clostridium sp.]MBP3214689.1 trigger factor [Clostridium sp.]MBQ4149892.1 trigger factor [Clostridium sp.]MBQ5422075.1 trigger factor [Clostridium sp.]HAE81679.1 trigger factor [Lachnoclostridium sp.]